MAKQKRANNSATPVKPEADSAYFLKLVLYVLLGMFWLRLAHPLEIAGLEINALPVGLAIGLMLSSHDKFQIDRKIEYAVLIVVAVIAVFLPIGIVV